MTHITLPKNGENLSIDVKTLQMFLSYNGEVTSETENGIEVVLYNTPQQESYDADVQAGIADDIAGNYASDEEVEEMFVKWEEKLASTSSLKNEVENSMKNWTNQDYKALDQYAENIEKMIENNPSKKFPTLEEVMEKSE